MQSFKEYLFFVFCLLCFWLLSNNTLHVIFYTYICYSNTFQYKYIIQSTFHVEKQSHARVTLKGICLLFITLFICLFPFCIDFVLFQEALLSPLLRTLRHFLTFIFVCFHWKITWYLGKVNKKVKTERASNWIDTKSLCLG